MSNNKKNTNPLAAKQDEYMRDFADALQATTTTIYSLQYELETTNTQMDMIAILSNAVSEILLAKKLITEEELKDMAASLKEKLDEQRESQHAKLIALAKTKYYKDMMEKGPYGRA